MRVLFNLLDAGIGGGQTVALGVAGELVRRGHGVGVVVPAPGPATDRFAAIGATVQTAQLVSLRRPGVVRGARIARDYDLVYSHTSVPGAILGGAVATVARRAHVVHQHPYPHFSPRPRVRAVQRALYGRLLSQTDVIAVADHVADAVVAAGVPRGRIDVIPNGVELPPKPSPPRRDGRLRIGLLGRLDPSKGIDVFVRAAELVGDSADFVVGAPSDDGPYARKVLAAARRAGVATVVPPGPAFIRDLDVVVLASRHEGHPLVLLEAMALGKAVAAARIPGIREVIETGRTGVMFPPGDADALAATLRSLIEAPEFREALGARAREVAAARYALADVHDRIIALLERAAAERG